VDGLRREVDLLTCNPPYIPTGRLAEMPTEIVGHEPALAFDGGPLGVRILVRLIREAPRLLRPGGWLAFEVGLGQGPAVEQRLLKSGDYIQVDRVMDAAGQVRALLAQRGSGP
jgi:release factor glutamine methyltransferase